LDENITRKCGIAKGKDGQMRTDHVGMQDVGIKDEGHKVFSFHRTLLESQVLKVEQAGYKVHKAMSHPDTP